MVIPLKAINDQSNIEKITKLLNHLEIDFINIEHYILAFIHRSIVNERPDYAPNHNERLEFL
jgi:dsRNA-specific ribonuclease